MPRIRSVPLIALVLSTWAAAAVLPAERIHGETGNKTFSRDLPEAGTQLKDSRKKAGKAKQTLKEPPVEFHGTFIKELKNAPFPYSGKVADTKTDFFDYEDPETGERFHSNAFGDRMPERIHYRDRSVLFHIPAHFDPHKPFFYIVFFHGIFMDVQTCIRDFRLNDQLDASGRNAILIAPQLAWNAPDSSPGKFYRHGAFKAFMHEAGQTLSQLLGKDHQNRLERAPLVLSAFSGGYRSVAYILDRGAVAERVRGVFLMDALYDDLDKYQKWLSQRTRKSFFAHIFTEGSCEENTLLLANFLDRRHIPYQTSWPEQIRPGEIVFLKSTAQHMRVPTEGPPGEPLKNMLQNLAGI
ncbi:MAG: hypothetical protein HGA84_06185 [Syntrophobacteraceae bacterium]|nr:hypothetical protein [Syntrophobacteraceae bacterium]